MRPSVTPSILTAWQWSLRLQRNFGCSVWLAGRRSGSKPNDDDSHELRWEATRLREKPVIWSLLLVLVANGVVFAAMAMDATAGRLELARLVTFASAALGTSMIAFGGLSWALDSAAAPTGTVLRLQESMKPAGSLPLGKRAATRYARARCAICQLRFAYPHTSEPVLDGFDLTIPAGPPWRS